MPSLRILACRVVRFMPNSTAAPRGPWMRQHVARRARRMCSRWVSSNVAKEFALAPVFEPDWYCKLAGSADRRDVENTGEEETFRSLIGTRNSFPGDRQTAR